MSEQNQQGAAGEDWDGNPNGKLPAAPGEGLIKSAADLLAATEGDDDENADAKARLKAAIALTKEPVRPQGPTPDDLREHFERRDKILAREQLAPLLELYPQLKDALCGSAEQAEKVSALERQVAMLQKTVESLQAELKKKR